MAGGRGTWLRLNVARRVVESDIVVSLHLVSEDGVALPPFSPGQFLTLKIPGPGGRPLPRTYSLSGDPEDLSHYRLSVKHERAPVGRPDLADGVGSSHVHALPPGAGVEALPPRGDFVLDETSARPVLLLAGGIGVTPLVAMAHRLARQEARPATMIHACANGQVQALADEMRALALGSRNFRYVTCLEAPSESDRERGLHAHVGQVDPDLLRAELPIGDYDCYLCGPAGFMQACYRHLVGLGVRQERIRYEFFGPAATLSATIARPAGAQPALAPATPEAVEATPAAGAAVVTFAGAGFSRPWDGSHRTLLDFAEAQGLTPAFSCRNGICNTCITGLVGAVAYVDEPLDMPPPGRALLCCSVPVGPVTLEL